MDSQSVIHPGKNLIFHSRPRHIDVRYHWIRDALDANLLELAQIRRPILSHLFKWRGVRLGCKGETHL